MRVLSCGLSPLHTGSLFCRKLEEKDLLMIPLASYNLKLQRSLNPEECVTFFEKLRQEINSATESGDLELLKTKVYEWSDLVDSKDSFLFEDLLLIHPLALAVLADRPKATEFLVQTCGLRLDPFHSSSCDCRLCHHLAIDRRFLHRYLDVIVRAATQPLYVVYASPDCAFRHCLKLWNGLLRYKENVCASSWQPIVNRLEETVVTLLDVASNEEEAIQLLDEPDDESYQCSPVEQRLKIVLGFVRARMYRACMNPSVQSVVEHEWTGGCSNPIFRRLNLSKASVPANTLFAIINYYVIVPLTILCPHPRLVKHIEIPQVRYEVSSMSYWSFMIVTIFSGHMTHPNTIMVCIGRDAFNKLSSVATIQWIFGVMIFANILRYITAIWYCQSLTFIGGYDILHFLSIIFYAIGTTLILIFIFVFPARRDVKVVCEWLIKVPNISKYTHDCDFTKKLHENYPQYPQAMTSMKEPYVAGAILVSIGHLLYYVSFGQNLYMIKPMSVFAIAAEKMVVDAFKWLFFMLIFLAGFSNAMLTLYKDYKCGNAYFTSINEGWKRMFWVLFAMTDTEDSKVTGAFAKNPTKIEQVSSVVGNVVYSAFFLIGTIILVNLLIALMSVTYQAISDNCDEIRILGETKMKLKYVLWNDSLPLPFNLLYPFYIINRYIWTRILKPKRRDIFFQSPAVRRIHKEREKYLKYGIAVQSKKLILIQNIKGRK